jgi:protein-tyrosine phosphatase
MMDLHSHILPGLDDGPLDWEESLLMARFAVEDGIKGMVCTPHWVRGVFDNGRARILNAVHTFREKLHENAIPLEVYPGSELRIDTDILGRIKSGELLSLNDTGAYVLIELPSEVMFHGIEDFFRELQAQGITPVLAHPERTMAFHINRTRLYNLVLMGVLLQVTSDSVLGKFGKEAKELAVQIVKQRMAHVLATDAHSLYSRRPTLSAAYKLVRKLADKDIADRAVYEIPKMIVQGQSIPELEEPIPFQRNRYFNIPFLKRFL